jgi:hypothetical protein
MVASHSCVDDDIRIVVADSNRFSVAGTKADLRVVDVQRALAGKASVLGTIPAGAFPREMALSKDTLLLTNYDAGQLEAIDIKTLP